MNKEIELVRQTKARALAGGMLTRAEIIALLEIDPESTAAQELLQAARAVASHSSRDQAYLWAAIGIDYRACPMNCHYCALGEKWGLVGQESELSAENVVDIAKKYVEEGVHWIVLRTTQFYSLEKLMELARTIRRQVPGDYRLVANTGEFTDKIAEELVEAGFEYIYHTVRLREGIDTPFRPEDRRSTLAAIKRSPLKLVALVEPIGVEHSNAEIADAFLEALEYGAVITGAMARVPVAGTPLGQLPPLSELRLAQIAAVTRLAAGIQAPDICVHPASEAAIAGGANVVVVETGAIPRDGGCNISDDWQGFAPARARGWFKNQAYAMTTKEKA